MPGTKEIDEALARYVMQSTLGVPVTKVDGEEKGDRLPDATFPTGAGRRGIVEVVSTRDARTTKLSDQLSREYHVKLPELRQRWSVSLTNRANVRRLKTALPPLLAQLEEAGIDNHRRRWHLPPGEKLPPGLEPEQPPLPPGVDHVWAGHPTEKHPAGYTLWGPVVADWQSDPDVALSAIEDFLDTRPDKARKLADNPGDDRHLVVALDFKGQTYLQPFLCISDGGCPTRPPVLQPGVDALWLLPLAPHPSYRCAYWPPGGEWRALELDVPHELPTGDAPG